jgi:hypothetical protein
MTPPERPTGPARNRVSPTGGIVAAPGRGAWLGNRGRLHEGTGARDVVRDYRGKAWITCLLSFQGRHQLQWQPHHYTHLFLLDEAVAMAAGHRPCAECRRADYNAFRTAWADATGGPPPRAREVDDQLHAERRRGPDGRRRTHHRPWADVPDGVFVVTEHGPAVVVGDHLTDWDEARNAYTNHRPRPRSGDADVLTPPSTVAVLEAGYPVQIDPSA